MPDALPLTGLYGKVPAHGDFVRRRLPTSFVGPWDAWLQQGMAEARERLGDRWTAVWDDAPPWRFALPAGACGPDAVAGVMLSSEDMVGRRFPITLAAILPPDGALPAPGWFAALEAAAIAGRAGRLDADGLAAAIPAPDAELSDVVASWPLLEAIDPPPAAPTDAEGFGQAWAAAAMPAADSAVAAAADDVIGLLGGGATAPEEMLGLLAGTDMPAASGDVLGTDTDGANRAAGDDDVLGLLMGSASVAPAASQDPAASDGTLAFLLGEGAGATESPAALLPGGASDAVEPGPADPLAALIASGASPLIAEPIEVASPTSPIQDVVDRLPAEAVPPPLAAPTEVPAAPPEGGWWTGGGRRLPPAVRPIAALLPPAEFVRLLEADA
ncbi:type VI secretion system-associated protein TagF [Roseomonas sp. HJA6]|uniref:Type VI secretion system-associated protein TagF n=1 Tax=Roseomonas alba TaxID=2846776 RepID=A0ABS7AGU2_9PROT|nr:type VI secretion system-associated protein TagF [Neoroseomonas alba]MBW6400952.1 type VI secretion system-associated protein TagF [Neoroseomonas alba]